MTCSHCGRALDAQAWELGACRYCGHGLPDQAQPQQNVSSTSWSDTSSNNNLPTEFGPLTVAPPDAFAPARGTAPFSVPPSAANVPPPGGPLPLYQPVSAPARKGRGKTLALAIVAGVLLLVLIGGGLLFARGFNKAPAEAPTSTQSSAAAAPSPTASPTPTPIPTTAYRDPTGLFSISYPGGWTQAAFSPRGVPFPLPLSGVRFSGGQAEFVILTGQEAPLMPTNGLAAQADDTLLGTMNARNISSAQPVQIGEQTWTEKSADTSGGKHTVIASINFHQHIYSLWYNAPASEFSADEQQFFNPMIASFSFGG